MEKITLEAISQSRYKKLFDNLNFSKEVETYLMIHFVNNSQARADIARAQNMDGHYVLSINTIAYDPKLLKYKPLQEERYFGVAHTKEEAEKRLHSRIRDLAERIAGVQGIQDLVDNTSFAPERLPRGGK